MDINALGLSDDPVVKELIMPDGTKTGAFLHLVCTDHPKYLEAERKIQIRQLKKMADKGGNISFNIKDLDAILDDNENVRIERATACVVGWDGITDNGEDLSFSEDNLKSLLSGNRTRWIVDFINDFASDRANFIKNS